MRDKTISLKDGRKLGYIEYGKPDGIPVMLFHGTPGSKAWFIEDDEIALSLGLRLIATDRPGFGTSDPKKNRTLLDWADDIVELADQLGIHKFSIIGVSGGGAYAAACAYKIPTRLDHVSLVASTVPFEGGKPPKSMMQANRRAFFMAKHLPWLLRMAYNAQKKMMEEQPQKFIQSMKTGNKHLAEWDQQFIRTDEQGEEMLIQMKEAFKHSVDEGINEPILMTKPWGFDVRDIHFPIHIWHGEADKMAPFEEMVKVAAAIPNSQVHFVPGAGHFLASDEGIWKSILTTIREEVKQLSKENQNVPFRF